MMFHYVAVICALNTLILINGLWFSYSDRLQLHDERATSSHSSMADGRSVIGEPFDFRSATLPTMESTKIVSSIWCIAVRSAPATPSTLAGPGAVYIGSQIAGNDNTFNLVARQDPTSAAGGP